MAVHVSLPSSTSTILGSALRACIPGASRPPQAGRREPGVGGMPKRAGRRARGSLAPMADLSLFATVPRGLESLLAGELRGLGAAHVKQVRAGVAFSGSLETAYRTCLWSRVAGRVLLPVTSGKAADGDELYKTAQGVDWSHHLDVDATLAVDFTGANDRIRDTRFGAVRIKDAIVDQFRATSGGKRPSVDARAPDVRVNAHLAGTRVAISIDLSGQSLHRRGYRAEKVQVEAPLKENLAAGLLLYAAWPARPPPAPACWTRSAGRARCR